MKRYVASATNALQIAASRDFFTSGLSWRRFSLYCARMSFFLFLIVFTFVSPLCPSQLIRCLPHQPTRNAAGTLPRVDPRYSATRSYKKVHIFLKNRRHDNGNGGEFFSRRVRQAPTKCKARPPHICHSDTFLFRKVQSCHSDAFLFRKVQSTAAFHHICAMSAGFFYAFIIAVAILVDNARSVSISRAASEKSRAAPAPFAVSIFPSLTTLADTTEAPVSLSSNPG